MSQKIIISHILIILQGACPVLGPLCVGIPLQPTTDTTSSLGLTFISETQSNKRNTSTNGGSKGLRMATKKETKKYLPAKSLTKNSYDLLNKESCDKVKPTNEKSHQIKKYK